MEKIDATPAAARGHRTRLALAALLFAGTAGLVGYTSFRAVRREGVVPPPPFATSPVEEAEAANRRREFAGVFATGNRPGDRTLTLHADGRVAFAEIGAKDPTTGDTDTYQVRRRDKKLVLVATRTGVIEIADLDTLLYWGDTYRRR